MDPCELSEHDVAGMSGNDSDSDNQDALQLMMTCRTSLWTG